MNADHTHPFEQVGTLATQAEPRAGGTTPVYNADGTIQKIQAYRDAAKTILWWVETWTYNADGSLLSIRLDTYDDSAESVIDTETVTFAYSADGSLAGEINS